MALAERMREWGTREWAWLAAALAAIVYLPSLGNGFAYDDLLIIVQDRTIRSLGGIPELLVRPYWPGEDGVAFGLWRPVTSISLSLLWVVSDGTPWVFHLANVLLHAAVTAGVVVVGARVLPVRVAAIAGLVFAVHPVHVEAVANGVGIAELLAAGFILLALERATRGGEARAAQGSLPTPSSRVAEARDVGFLYLLAFLSKESAVVLPGLLFLLDAGRGRWTAGDVGAAVRERGHLYVGMAGVAAAVLLARTQILGTVADPTPALGAQLLAEIPRIHTVGEIWAEQLRLLAWPARLTPDYAPAVLSVTTVWTMRGAAAVVAVLSFLAGSGLWFRTRRRGADDAVPLGILWYVVAVSPITNLVFVAGVLVAERTLYLPSIGACWAVAGLWGVATDARRRPAVQPAAGPDPESSVGLRAFRPLGLGPVGLGLLAVVLIAGGARSIRYQPAWASQEAIFEHMVEATPESGRSAWIRGDYLAETGDLSGALREYRVAIGRLGPEYVFLTETARRLLSAQLPEAAVPLLTRAFEAQPRKVLPPRLMTVIRAREERWPEAELWAQRTLERDSEDRTALHLLSAALAGQERWTEAVEARERVIELGEGRAWQQWFWLIELRARAGDSEGAREAADSARIRAPGADAVRQIDSLSTAFVGALRVSQNSGVLQNTTAPGAIRRVSDP